MSAWVHRDTWFCSRADTPASTVARLTCLSAVLSLGACEQIVALGSECRTANGHCVLDGSIEPSDDSPAESERDAQTDDESEAHDAEVRDPGSKLEIENPNFDRSGGADGDIVIAKVAENILGSLFKPLLGSTTTLQGWYACWPLSVNTSSQSIDNAKAMGPYLSITPSTFNLSDFVAVRQELPRPLRAGEQVHMRIQTIARNSDQARMFLEVRGNTEQGNAEQCGNPNGTLLGRSAVIADHADWSPICLSFEASSDFPVLMLKPAAEGSLPPLGQTQPTLLLDTIQVVDACP